MPNSKANMDSSRDQEAQGQRKKKRYYEEVSIDKLPATAEESFANIASLAVADTRTQFGIQNLLVASALVRDAMSTSRSRQQRGAPRGNGQGSGEEAELWKDTQNDIKQIPDIAYSSEDIRVKIEAKKNEINARSTKPSPKEIDDLNILVREGIKSDDELAAIIRDAMEKTRLVKALVEANETTLLDPTRRGGNSRENTSRSSMAMDLDGPNDSPAPSPIADKPRKERMGPGRSSLPPVKEQSAGYDGGEGNANETGSEVNAKGKIVFAFGADVAFRPKATGNEEPDWIQGKVIKVIGEGKSRRYDVQDPEPDEITKKPGRIYRSSASSMVTIPPPGQPLGDYSKGKAVLARYPDTTTFYRAEVVGMNGGMVNLKFEGEEDAQVTTEVDRRFVLDHKG